jgi:hypothetical protein
MLMFSASRSASSTLASMPGLAVTGMVPRDCRTRVCRQCRVSWCTSEKRTALTVVADYKSGVQWIQQQVNSKPNAKTDDTRYWYQVPAI